VPLSKKGVFIGMKVQSLDRFLYPESVAIFGSMFEGWFFGPGVIIKDLKDIGYRGAIYPVHPSAESIYGLKVYHDVKEIEGEIDLAIVITSYRYVNDIIQQCGEKGVKAAVVVSDGFGEAGSEGRKMQAELLSTARSFDMRIIGPNTLGLLNNAKGFTTIPYEKGYEYAKNGPLSIVTQTGMYGPQAIALDDYSFGVSKIIDLGNMCDLDEIDCLEYLEDDPDTKVISLYIEHTKRPQRFLDVARRISMKKPILCLKGGISPEAAKAMASHTGSMAGDDRLYEGLFHQTGLIRVEEYRDLLDLAKVFIYQPLPAGNRLGIITFSGAIGIHCVDTARVVGLELGKLSERSKERLLEVSHLLNGHPIDLGPASAAAGAEVFNFYTRGFEVLLEDENIDCIYLNTYVNNLLLPQSYEGLLEVMSKDRKKPTVLWSYGASEHYIREMATLAEQYGIPFFSTNQKAIKALGHMNRYVKWKNARTPVG
jgi:acyl-CoA synthetase (NDP forming)